MLNTRGVPSAATIAVSPLSRSLREAGLILGLAVVWGLVWNALDPQGVALDDPIPPRSATDPRYIDHPTAERLWRGSPDTVFVDVRNDAGWNNGHIPGSLHLPFDRYGAAWGDLAARLRPGDDIVVYCDGPHCDLALQMLDRLRELGYMRLRVYEGGWQTWYASGLERERVNR